MAKETEQTLTNIQETQIELIVIRAVDAYHKAQSKLIDEKISTHLKTCPVGEDFRIMKAKFFGLLVGIGVGSAGIGGSVAVFISKLFA